MAGNRRLLWLGATLIVAIVALMVVRSTDDRTSAATRPVATAQPSRSAPGNTRPTPAVSAADVRLDALARVRGEPANQGRNPFRFQPKAPPPAPAALRPAPTDTTSAPMPMVPTGPPPPPPIPLKFIGLVEKADGTRIAVLSDGRRPISGIEGQEIDGRYRILKIGNESIEIAYIDGRGRQTIKLTGQ